MVGSYPRSEVLPGLERRRRWSVAEKLAMVDETGGVSYRTSSSWRRLAEQGALATTQAEEEVVPASAFRAQQDMIRELQRLLGKKTLKTEILKEALGVATDSKKAVPATVAATRQFPMTAVCETLGVARSNIARRVTQSPSKRRGRQLFPKSRC